MTDTEDDAEGHEKTLRDSSQEIAENMREELQKFPYATLKYFLYVIINSTIDITVAR